MPSIHIHLLDGLTAKLPIPPYLVTKPEDPLPPHFRTAVKNNHKLNPPYEMDLMHTRRYELRWSLPMKERAWIDLWGAYDEVHS